MKTILVIEDNEAVRENTAELLELAGYDVITALNGKVGYEKAKTSKPDVVICDIMMPETDGLGFLKLVKRDDSTRRIPIVFFSAGSAPPAVKRKSIQGADVYLSKPFTNEELLDAISYCLIKSKAN